MDAHSGNASVSPLVVQPKGFAMDQFRLYVSYGTTVRDSAFTGQPVELDELSIEEGAMRFNGRKLLDAHAANGDPKSDRVLLITNMDDLERLSATLRLTRLHDPSSLVHHMDAEVGSRLRVPAVMAIRYLTTCLDLGRPDHLMLVKNGHDARIIAGDIRFVPDGTEGHNLVITVRLALKPEARKRRERLATPASARSAAREGVMTFS